MNISHRLLIIAAVFVTSLITANIIAVKINFKILFAYLITS